MYLLSRVSEEDNLLVLGDQDYSYTPQVTLSVEASSTSTLAMSSSAIYLEEIEFSSESSVLFSFYDGVINESVAFSSSSDILFAAGNLLEASVEFSSSSVLGAGTSNALDVEADFSSWSIASADGDVVIQSIRTPAHRTVGFSIYD